MPFPAEPEGSGPRQASQMKLPWVALAVVVVACGGAGVSAVPTPPPSPFPVVELKYRVFDQVGRPWYCDRDFYPIARADEKVLARQRLPEMQKDADTWSAILAHDALGAGAALSDDQLLVAYHDWKDLQALELQPTGPAGVYGFTYAVRPTSGAKQSERVEGRISTAGKIDILSRQPAGPLNCPICLASRTLIDTPLGPVRVTELRPGDVVWTQDDGGRRVAEPILEVGSVEAPVGHEVVRVTLADGRAVTASPGHPLADGRAVGSLAIGDPLDGSTVAGIARLPYRGRTYDLLPAGTTRAYWADGVLLASTLGRWSGRGDVPLTTRSRSSLRPAPRATARASLQRGGTRSPR